MAEVKIGGVWLQSLGNVADVKWSTVWGEGPCGPDLASCTLAVDRSNDLALLRVTAPVEIWSDGVKVFGGVTSEPGRDYPRTLSFKGLGRRAGDFEALDSSGNPTTNPREAAATAIGNGLPWTNPNAFDNTPVGDADPSAPGRLNDVLDSWATKYAKRWGVDVEGVAFAATDPTDPAWFLDAADLDIGTADDGLYTRVRAWYVTSVDADLNPDGWDSVVVDDPAGQELYGVIEYTMNLNDLGLLAGGATEATTYAQAQLDLLTVPQWLSRVTTNSTRLLTKGGLPAHLPDVRAGQMVRLFNVPNTLGGLRGELSLDVVLGEVEYDTTSPTEITIAPVGLAVRNLADLAAQAKQAADAAKKAAS